MFLLLTIWLRAKQIAYLIIYRIILNAYHAVTSLLYYPLSRFDYVTLWRCSFNLESDARPKLIDICNDDLRLQQWQLTLNRRWFNVVFKFKIRWIYLNQIPEKKVVINEDTTLFVCPYFASLI